MLAVPRERPRRAGQWDLGWDIPGTGRLQRRDEDGSGELGVGAQISLGLEGRKEGIPRGTRKSSLHNFMLYF